MPITLMCSDHEGQEAGRCSECFNELWEWAVEAKDALMWCGGSGDFAPGGQAEEGWNKIVRPLLKDEPKCLKWPRK